MIDRDMRPSPQGAETFGAELGFLEAGNRIAWAVERFGERMALTSSFGAQSAVLLHLATRVAPRIPVYFINTGFLFRETLDFKAELEAALGLAIQEFRPRISRAELLRAHGRLYASDPDACCRINKVDVLQSAIADVDCWISGVRQAQAASRENKAVLEQRKDGRFKLHPLVDWPDEWVADYLRRYDLPVHPLAEQGYASIGCEPCTAKPTLGGDARSGRWAGTTKTECGIHDL